MSELLYDALFQEGSYTKSYDDFQSDFSTPENQLLLYETLNKEGAYTKSGGDFMNTFFPIPDDDKEITTPEVKEATPRPDATVDVEDTASTGEDDSSVTSDNETSWNPVEVRLLSCLKLLEKLKVGLKEKNQNLI